VTHQHAVNRLRTDADKRRDPRRPESAAATPAARSPSTREDVATVASIRTDRPAGSVATSGRAPHEVFRTHDSSRSTIDPARAGPSRTTESLDCAPRLVA
jgi:hypothetical protein